MKKFYVVLVPVIALLIVGLTVGFDGGTHLKNSSGAPAGYTNSPFDGQNCSHCMGGTAVAVDSWISSDIPITGYVVGETYSITVTASGTGKKGFELSPQALDGTLLGVLTTGSETKLVGSGKYITHTSSSSVDPKTWTFQWTAPDPGVGEVTFYASVAVGKLNTKTTTLTVQQSTVGLEEPVVRDFYVYPNPASERINIICNLGSEALVQFEFIDIHGKVIWKSDQQTGFSGTNQVTLIPEIPGGCYFLRMQTGSASRTTRVILL